MINDVDEMPVFKVIGSLLPTYLLRSLCD